MVACGGGDAGDGSDASTGAASSSSSSADADGSGSSAGETAVDTTGQPDALVPDAGADRYALVGETVVLDGSASSGAVLYQWDLDDGSAPAEPSTDPIVEVVYDAPGRRHPVLTVYDAGGQSLAAQVAVTVTFEPSHVPRQSGSIAIDGERIAVVAPDSDELALFERSADDAFALVERFATCDVPRTVTWTSDGALAVACQGDARVRVISPSDGASTDITLPRGARPFGIVADDGALFVTMQALGGLARIEGTEVTASFEAVADARGIAVLPDGRLAVSRWRSTDAIAELALVDPTTGERETASLRFDPKEASDTEAGGIPSWLDQVLVSPQADWIAVPSLQANIGQGEYLDGDALVFDETLRGIVSYLAWPSAIEDFDARKHFDNRGLMAAGVFSSRGDWLFLADRGSRSVERVDVFTGGQAGALLDVGLAPQGLALTADDRFLLVDAYMSRELVVYDVGSFDMLPRPVATLPIASAEPLSAEVLLGKQLFNDSLDPRLARDGYIACAHCHLDGETDRRTWDFTDRGEGLRNTISLFGRAGVGQGPIHWSANFDEVQDFENDIRGAFGGSGLLADADWQAGTTSATLGDPKAGLSADLDALAAYVTSLDAYGASPFRAADGTPTPDAEAGEVIFDMLGCATCHSGVALTDSSFLAPADPLLHDVGTLTAASGQRLGGPLVGLDTPTLHELWNTPPYLHDGSAATLLDVLTTRNEADLHGATSTLSAQELDQLVAYLLSLE
ncbi:MAG TPA: PKD domain-containing protein [Nannocystaceae bacterium]|nr:PKD domain-containing protein [Nannocystaceae bacterium]